jgi:hypothetical protein
MTFFIDSSTRAQSRDLTLAGSIQVNRSTAFCTIIYKILLCDLFTNRPRNGEFLGPLLLRNDMIRHPERSRGSHPSRVNSRSNRSPSFYTSSRARQVSPEPVNSRVTASPYSQATQRRPHHSAIREISRSHCSLEMTFLLIRHPEPARSSP